MYEGFIDGYELTQVWSCMSDGVIGFELAYWDLVH